MKLFTARDIKDIREYFDEGYTYDQLAQKLNERVSSKMPTPIKCKKTGEQLFIGDKVKGSQNQYGYLYFEDYLNQYVIRSESGGNHKSSTFEKVTSLEPNTSNVGVECRRNPNKQKW